jgi:energy-coupling factor transport system substrate-specific component
MTNTTEGGAGRIGLLGRIAADFTSRAWVLIPIGIGINVVGGVVANLLRLPIFLDSIGTIMVGLLAGPWVAALTGLLTNLILGLVSNPVLIPFSVVNMAIGLAAGFLAYAGWFRSLWKVAVSGVVLTLVAVLVATPIRVLVFGGVTGHGYDVIFAYFLATGNSLMESVLTTGFIVEPIDKIISAFVAFFIARAIPMRYRPPKARRTLPE